MAYLAVFWLASFLLKFFILFFIDVYACVCVCAHVCKYSQRPNEDMRFSEARMAGGSDLSNVGNGKDQHS